MSNSHNVKRKSLPPNEKDATRHKHKQSYNDVSNEQSNRSIENELAEKPDDHYTTAKDLGFQPIVFDHASGLWRDIYKWIFRRVHMSKDMQQMMGVRTASKPPGEELIKQKSIPKLVTFGASKSRSKDSSPDHNPKLSASLSKFEKGQKLPPIDLQQINQNQPQKIAVSDSQREYIMTALKQEHVMHAMKDIERSINNLASSPRYVYDERNLDQFEKQKKKQTKEIAEIIKKNLAQLFDKHGRFNPLQISTAIKPAGTPADVTAVASPEKSKEKRPNEKNSELDDSFSSPLDSERLNTNSKKGGDNVSIKADAESVTKKDLVFFKTSDQDWRPKKSLESINSIDNEMNQQNSEVKLHRRKSDQSHYYGGECKKITKLCHLFLPLQINEFEFNSKQDELRSVTESSEGASAMRQRKSLKKLTPAVSALRGKMVTASQITEHTEETEEAKSRNDLGLSLIKRSLSMNKRSSYRVLSQKFDPVIFVPRILEKEASRKSIAALESQTLIQNSLTKSKVDASEKIEEHSHEEVEAGSRVLESVNLSQKTPTSVEKIPKKQKEILEEASPRAIKEKLRDSVLVIKMKKDLQGYQKLAENLAKKTENYESAKNTSRYATVETEQNKKVYKRALNTVLVLNSKAKSSLFRNSQKLDSKEKETTQNFDQNFPSNLVTIPANQLHVSDLKRPVTVIRDRRYSFEYVNLKDADLNPYTKTANLYVPNHKKYSHDCEKLTVGVGPKSGKIVKGYSLGRRTQSEIKIRPKTLAQSHFRK